MTGPTMPRPSAISAPTTIFSTWRVTASPSSMTTVCWVRHRNGKPRVAALNALPRPSLSDRPAVSIIVPVYGQLAYTLNCLHSLLTHASHHNFEIIIGDDASRTSPRPG
ncbi:MAG: glycosyltransferase [Asticcacaulis sp.]